MELEEADRERDGSLGMREGKEADEVLRVDIQKSSRPAPALLEVVEGEGAIDRKRGTKEVLRVGKVFVPLLHGANWASLHKSHSFKTQTSS